MTEQENARLKSQLRKLRADASANSEILKRAQNRELSLLESVSLHDLFVRLTLGLRDSFSVSEATLVLCDPDHEVRHLIATLSNEPVPPGVMLVDKLDPYLSVYRDVANAWLGPFESRHSKLYSRPDRLASVAILPLRRDGALMGSLNLGCNDRRRFTKQHGTDFLQHLAAVASFCIENGVYRARMRRSGFTDVLTGWHNRRYLEERMHEEVARARRNRMALACLMIDIDHFKQVNDTCGHLAGDEVLRQVAERIAQQVRSSDVAARFGGEEFVVLMPDTDERLAMNLAERIRAAVIASPILVDSDHAISVTVSVGVAAERPDADGNGFAQEGLALLDAADEAMYRAKHGGRDRVVTAVSVPILNEID